MNPLVFSIYLSLLEKRKVTRAYLCEKYEISRRSVSRYIELLTRSGVPIISLPGINGGFMIPDDYKIDKMLFTQTEQARIINSLNATIKSFDDNINSVIIDKLNSLGGANKIMHPSFVFGGVVIDAGSWSSPYKHRNKIDVINMAMAKKRTLRLKYTDRNTVDSERYFDPYALVLKQGIWYVYGYCRIRSDFRLFRLSRIKDIVVRDFEFEVKQNADVYEKLEGRFDTPLDEVDIIIEFSSLILSQIEEWLGPEAIYEEGAAYRAAATVNSGQELLSTIMSFGSGVRVISPAKLKEQVLSECRIILKNI